MLSPTLLLLQFLVASFFLFLFFFLVVLRRADSIFPGEFSSSLLGAAAVCVCTTGKKGEKREREELRGIFMR